MAKIRLGSAPEFIGYKATFTGWDGKEQSISGNCKYRTRRQWAAMQQAVQDKSRSEERPDASFTVTEQQDRLMRFSAEFLAENLTSWDLVDTDGEALPVNVENLMELADQCPQAITALTIAYNSAMVDGRLGN